MSGYNLKCSKNLQCISLQLTILSLQQSRRGAALRPSIYPPSFSPSASQPPPFSAVSPHRLSRKVPCAPLLAPSLTSFSCTATIAFHPFLVQPACNDRPPSPATSVVRILFHRHKARYDGPPPSYHQKVPVLRTWACRRVASHAGHAGFRFLERNGSPPDSVRPVRRIAKIGKAAKGEDGWFVALVVG